MADIREYVERNGQGIPGFAPGTIYEINGERRIVIRIVGRRNDPLRIDVESEPYVEGEDDERAQS